MCAYNKINGTYASEHHWLLTDVLRDEWGFDGLVVSDWGAVHDRVAALTAGLDLEMPPDLGVSDTAWSPLCGTGTSTRASTTSQWAGSSISLRAPKRAAGHATRWMSTLTMTWLAMSPRSVRCC